MKAMKRLDTNSDKWFKSEQEQMKRIHRVYRDSMREDVLAYRAADLALVNSGIDEIMLAAGAAHQEQRANNFEPSQHSVSTDADKKPGEKKADTESFLPRDSCLRSEKGENIRPGNCPFKDYDSFMQTLSIEYWRQNFVEEGHDRFLTETAESVVSHLCSAQASRDLRVRHGSKPLGKYWRAKREQITPLALTIHELKLWATNRLRVAAVMDETTYLEIGRRIKYIQGLQRKEVWGPSTMTFQQGMRPIAHDKLFRLLLTMREDLTRAKDYSFRGYCRRKSREKLGRLGNLLKNVFLNECRIVSLLGSFDHIISEPTSPRLQPTDLLNQAHNQIFVDYNTNWVNVCLKALCEIPLVKSAVLGDFGGESDEQNPLQAIKEWPNRNLFCKRVESASMLAIDVETGMPEIYCKTWEKLGDSLKAADKKAKIPIKPAAWSSHLKTKVFALPADAVLVCESIVKLLAAIQDLVPAMHAAHEMWTIAGEGGDFTLYDTLRGTVVYVMGDIIARVYAVQCAEKNLIELFEGLSEAHQDAMESRRLKTKKAEYEPNWVGNLRYIQNEYLAQSRRGFAENFKQAQEIARDAWDYSLTKAKLDDKISKCKSMGEALCGESIPSQPLKGDFSMAKVVDLKKKDWIGVSGQRSDELPSSPIASTETGKYQAEQAALDKEAEELKREYENSSHNQKAANIGSFGLGGEDMSEDELEKHADETKNPFASNNSNPFQE